MAKKIIEDALIDAADLEEAALENAKAMVIEAFSPDMTEFFKDILSEGEDPEEDMDDDEDEIVDEGEDFDFEEKDDDEIDEALKGDQDKIDIDDDGDIDADDLANLRAGKEDDDIVNEIDDDVDPDLMKQVSPNLDESDDNSDDDEEVDLDVEDDEEPESKDDSKNNDSEDDSEEEFEVPEELFDDEDSSDSKDDGDEDDIELSDDLDEDDEEVDLDIEDDGDESETADSDEFDGPEDDEIEEGLYIRKEGEFSKITPEEYLNIRKSELDEENEKLTAAIGALKGQLEEVNLFNAKLANVNKLFESGQFTKQEKANFVSQIDECESIEKVKELYESTMEEINETYNPLNEFSEILSEHRNRKLPENVYQSPEMARMRRMAGLD